MCKWHTHCLCTDVSTFDLTLNKLKSQKCKIVVDMHRCNNTRVVFWVKGGSLSFLLIKCCGILSMPNTITHWTRTEWKLLSWELQRFCYKSGPAYPAEGLLTCSHHTHGVSSGSSFMLSFMQASQKHPLVSFPQPPPLNKETDPGGWH